MPVDRWKRRGLFALIAFFIVSAIAPYERATWMLEVFPVVLGLPLLLWWDQRENTTRLVYLLTLFGCALMIYGGIYTYSRVPLGFWMQDWFGFARNHYDRLGHIVQGIVPALITRELLLRRVPGIRAHRALTFLLCLGVALGVAVIYELIEWGSAILFGNGAVAFLGTQGDAWDAQEDMALAGLGAIGALIFLTRLHDRELAKIAAR